MGKTVVVTGASSGIGAACVSAFKESGARVIGVDARASSSADVHHQLDLAYPTCGSEFLTLIGDIEVKGLVNNAGIGLDKPAVDTTADDFDSLIAVNLRAPFLLAAALHPKLAESDGFVVNVASVHAVATSRMVAAYAAAKGGLVAMTRALAIEWAPRVRVNAVLPGAIHTEMLEQGLFRTGSSLEDLASRHPLVRIGMPSDVAQMVVDVAENQFATGSTFVVDGGATARLSTE